MSVEVEVKELRPPYWGLISPKGQLMFAGWYPKKQAFYRNVEAGAPGKTWKQLYRKGWRVVPVRVTNEKEDGTWCIATTILVKVKQAA